MNKSKKDSILNNSSLNISTTSIALLNDEFLRRLYQVGYNPKLISKDLSHSIKFSEEIKKVVNLIENNEITIKSCGPLILGLIRVYDKSVKNLLNEVKNFFIDKKQKRIQNKDENINEEEVIDVVTQKISKSKKKDNQIISKDYMFQNSPLKSGIYSFLADNQPEHFLREPFVNSDLKLSSSQKFRGNIMSEESHILKEINNEKSFEDSKFKENFRNERLLMDNSLFDEQNILENNNFFFAINESQKKGKTNFLGSLMDISNNDTIQNIEFKNDSTVYDRDVSLQFRDHKMKLDIKFNKELDEKINQLTKLSKKTKKLFSDVSINLDLKNDFNFDNTIDNSENTDLLLFRSIWNRSGTFFIEELKKSKFLTNEKIKSFINNDELNLNPSSFSPVEILPNYLNEIKDFSNENEREQNEEINQQDEYINSHSINHNFDMKNNESEDLINQYQDQTNSLNEKIKVAIKSMSKKKIKEIKMNSILQKISDFPIQDIFYSLLTLAQKGDFDLVQKKVFSEENIYIQV